MPILLCYHIKLPFLTTFETVQRIHLLTIQQTHPRQFTMWLGLPEEQIVAIKGKPSSVNATDNQISIKL